MAVSWKLVIDSTNASALADVRAAALGYEVEDPGALIKQLLDAGRIGAEAVVEHRGRETFRGYPAIRHPEDPFEQTSGDGRGRRRLFQDVPEGKSGKNRCESTSTVRAAASTSWWPGWNSWGQPASVRSARDPPGTGGSCRTPKGTSSARRSRSRAGGGDPTPRWRRPA